MKLPLFVRKLIVDWVETAVGLLLGLTLVIPGDLDTAKAEALVVGAALLSALVSAARRAAPAFLRWVRVRMRVAPAR